MCAASAEPIGWDHDYVGYNLSGLTTLQKYVLRGPDQTTPNGRAPSTPQFFLTEERGDPLKLVPASGLPARQNWRGNHLRLGSFSFDEAIQEQQ